MRFTPGQLSAGDAARLNEMWRAVEQFRRLTVAPPLAITRNAGIPVISGPSALAVLAEVTADDGGTPPVHTAKRKTRDADNTVADFVPQQLFDRVLNPLEETLPAGTLSILTEIADYRGWYWAFPLDELPPTSAADGCDGSGWAWVAGLLETDALKMDVLSAAGLCAEIDDTQEGFLLWDAGASKWVLKEWDWTADGGNGDWVDLDFAYEGGSGTLSFWLDGGRPRLQIGTVSYDLVLKCGGPGVIVFSGGTTVVCGETTAADCCENTFEVRLRCWCYPIDGWGGTGIYVVSDGAGGCTVVELTEGAECGDAAGDECDDDWVIQDGPFATEAEAEAECTPSPVETGCCPDDDTPRVLTAALGSGFCPDFNGLEWVLTYQDAGGDAGKWTGSRTVGANTLVLKVYCDTSTWKLDSLCNGSGSTGTVATSAACDPFEVQFSGLVIPTCCTGLGTVVTVTA